MPKPSSESEAGIVHDKGSYQIWIPSNVVDLTDLFLWCTILMMFVDPFFRFLIGIIETKHHIMCRFVGGSMALLFYSLVSYGVSFVVFIMFQKAMTLQPKVRTLQVNELLLIGYLFIMTGFGIKASVHFSKSLATIMGGQCISHNSLPRKHGPSTPYYHPLGTSSVICLFGFALVFASPPGVIMTVSHALGYWIAYQCERVFIERDVQQHSSAGNKN